MGSLREGIEFSQVNYKEYSYEKNPDLLEDISVQLEEITSSGDNPALLPRKRDYFQGQIKSGRCAIFLDNENKIIASGIAQELVNGIYEYGSIFVRKDFRGHEMGKQVINQLQTQDEIRVGVMTVKPNKPGNAGMIVDGIKAGFLPVSFSTLKGIDSEGYEKCCCCDTFQNDNCGLSDNNCVLLVDSTYPGIKEKSLKYMSTMDFLYAVDDIKLREKIVAEMSQYFSEQYREKLEHIRELIKFKIIKIGVQK